MHAFSMSRVIYNCTPNTTMKINGNGMGYAAYMYTLL